VIYRERPRPLQRGIIILPSAFTMGNLFFGVYAMVAAARGDLIWAGWFVVFAGILDMLDGRVARFTRTGSAFGAELDSLVDAVSFGVAPAFIIYNLYLADGAWSWMLGFAYIAAVVVRLARFNVEQGGEAKTSFHGLPSPTAGMMLATYYPFSQTPFFETYLSALNWPQYIAVLTILLSVLMLSHVPYPLVPRIGVRTPRALASTAFLLFGTIMALTLPRYWFFPALVVYTAWGLGKAFVLGLLDRLPDRDPLLDEHIAPGETGDEVRSMDYGNLAPNRFDDRHLRDRLPEDTP
jgi:CDP-diacylglycerol--serine O-phosphatidyltransferase